MIIEGEVLSVLAEEILMSTSIKTYVVGTAFMSTCHKDIFCGYSLELACRGDSNEYPQHMFLWRVLIKGVPTTYVFMEVTR